MKFVTLSFGIATAASGLVSAYYWWRSAKVNYDARGNPDVFAGGQPVAQPAATVEYVKRTGELNAIAATWSAVTAFLTGGTALLSTVFPG